MIVTPSPSGSDYPKMENLFSMGGINFDNIAANDKVVTDKLAAMGSDGWQLVNITPGVFSDGKGGGIYMTRYLFRK
jgi:hypothetical protein